MNLTNKTNTISVVINISYENFTSANNESSQIYNEILEEFNVTNNDKYLEITRIIYLIVYPMIIIFGTIGNLLSLYIMRRGSLKDVSTFFLYVSTGCC